MRCITKFVMELDGREENSMYGTAVAAPYESPAQRRRMTGLGTAGRLSQLITAAATATLFYISWKLGDPSPLMTAGFTGLIVLVALRLLRKPTFSIPRPAVDLSIALVIAATVAVLVPVFAFGSDGGPLSGQNSVEAPALQSFEHLYAAEEWRAIESVIQPQSSSPSR